MGGKKKAAKRAASSKSPVAAAAAPAATPAAMANAGDESPHSKLAAAVASTSSTNTSRDGGDSLRPRPPGGPRLDELASNTLDLSNLQAGGSLLSRIKKQQASVAATSFSTTPSLSKASDSSSSNNNDNSSGSGSGSNRGVGGASLNRLQEAVQARRKQADTALLDQALKNHSTPHLMNEGVAGGGGMPSVGLPGAPTHVSSNDVRALVSAVVGDDSRRLSIGEGDVTAASQATTNSGGPISLLSTVSKQMHDTLADAFGVQETDMSLPLQV